MVGAVLRTTERQSLGSGMRCPISVADGPGSNKCRHGARQLGGRRAH